MSRMEVLEGKITLWAGILVAAKIHRTMHKMCIKYLKYLYAFQH